RSGGVPGPEFPGGTRSAHGIGRPERRGEIDFAEVTRRRAPDCAWNTRIGSQREGRLFFTVPRRDVEPEANRAADRAGYAEPGFRADRAHPAGLVPFSRGRCVQANERVEWWRKDATGTGEVAARSAEPLAGRRTDDASRYRKYRRVGECAIAISRDTDFYQSRRVFHPRGGEDGAAYQCRKTDALRGRLRLLSREVESDFRARGTYQQWRRFTQRPT